MKTIPFEPPVTTQDFAHGPESYYALIIIFGTFDKVIGNPVVVRSVDLRNQI